MDNACAMAMTASRREHIRRFRRHMYGVQLLEAIPACFRLLLNRSDLTHTGPTHNRRKTAQRTTTNTQAETRKAIPTPTRQSTTHAKHYSTRKKHTERPHDQDPCFFEFRFCLVCTSLIFLWNSSPCLSPQGFFFVAGMRGALAKRLAQSSCTVGLPHVDAARSCTTFADSSLTPRVPPI